MAKEKDLYSQNLVACLWDFDKTLIPGFMQSALFRHYGIDENAFWEEVNGLPGLYAGRGLKVCRDTVYLNHLLSYVRTGLLRGLNNAILGEMGKELEFFPGLPEFFRELKQLTKSKPEYIAHDIALEHYIISTGLGAMIRGSVLAPEADGIYGCEFVENPAPPGYDRQEEFDLKADSEISQIGVMVDNTVKTRFIFEINKGVNKWPEIDVNAAMRPEDRRIPIKNMLYIADGPSDVPVFSVMRKYGGKTFAVYDPSNPEEFAQNDKLLQAGRIHAYGPADYRPSSSTSMWIKMHVLEICDRVAAERARALSDQITKPPRYLHKKEMPTPEAAPRQETFLEEFEG